MKITLKMPRLHHRQMEVLGAWRARDDTGRALHRFFILRWGRRAGKTRLAVLLALLTATQRGQVWWVAPTFPHALVAWRLIIMLGTRIPGATIDRANMICALPGGGWVQVKSARHPEALRSEGLDVVIVDEAAHLPSANWSEIWEQSLRPALADRLGRAMFISTPKGFNHFYDLWRAAENTPGWWLSHVPTWENPFIPPAEIAEARRNLPPPVFAQEYGAEFTTVEGALFRREMLVTVPSIAEPVRARARGWDIAITPGGGDYTVGARLAMGESGTVYVEDVVRGQWAFPDVVRRIRETAERDGGEVVQVVESVGTQGGVYQTLEREPALAGIPLVRATPQRDKITRSLPLVARGGAGQLRILARSWTQALIAEMLAFPNGSHDDQIDALALALSGLRFGAVEQMSLPEGWL